MQTNNQRVCCTSALFFIVAMGAIGAADANGVSQHYVRAGFVRNSGYWAAQGLNTSLCHHRFGNQ
jgi:hypothetical protein